MTNQSPNHPEIEPLTRNQVLVVMGVTAVVLLIAAKIWQYFGSVSLLPFYFNTNSVLIALSLALIIPTISSLVYRLWPAYRESADFYLELVLKPLEWQDIVWLGLLPGLSEELLFRGVMLPALGEDIAAVVISSICFGVLHFSGSQQWPYVVWASFVGAILGMSAVLTGNLLVPVLAHIITNLISSSLWKLSNPIESNSSSS